MLEPEGKGPGFWEYDGHGNRWRSDWVKGIKGDWVISGSGDDPKHHGG